MSGRYKVSCRETSEDVAVHVAQDPGQVATETSTPPWSAWTRTCVNLRQPAGWRTATNTMTPTALSYVCVTWHTPAIATDTPGRCTRRRSAQGRTVQSDRQCPMLMTIDTFRERKSVTAVSRCVQSLRAQRTRGCLRATPFECTLAQTVIASGDARPLSERGLTSHVLQREEEELCVPSVLLCVVEAFGGYADSDDVEGTQEWPQRLPEDLSISILFQASLGKRLFKPTCDIDGLRSLPVRLRGGPTFRDIACGRLASATAPASRSRKTE